MFPIPDADDEVPIRPLCRGACSSKTVSETFNASIKAVISAPFDAKGETVNFKLLSVNHMTLRAASFSFQKVLCCPTSSRSGI